ncbi:GNAT family N-acetyltransferase [Desertihabitans aurantiacus]|uniref:GNAT family N-acetyltransferase n=1 Tax=Desertihabitans aurantiacus TaxID=2282477 RepID=UPI000DF8631C|nr:GNAT family N-acetyltransferase [Desertihabitans aurantiacus]
MAELILFADLSADPITMTTRLAPSALPLGILLRPARETDVEAMGTLRAESTGRTDVETSVAEVRATVDGRDGDYLPAASKVAVDEQDQVVAFVQTVGRTADGTDPFVVRVHTQPPWRGRGLGRALLIEAMRAAAETSDRVGLRVDSANGEALSLCRSLGFVEDGAATPSEQPSASAPTG